MGGEQAVGQVEWREEEADGAEGGGDEEGGAGDEAGGGGALGGAGRLFSSCRYAASGRPINVAVHVMLFKDLKDFAAESQNLIVVFAFRGIVKTNE